MYQCKSISTGETYERVSHLSQPLPWTCWHLLTSLKLNFIHDHAKWLLRRITYIIKSSFYNSCYLQSFFNFLRHLATGIVPSPFDCYLANRGCKTLHVRMERHMKNALAIAKYLENHRMVTKVIYPGMVFTWQMLKEVTGIR